MNYSTQYRSYFDIGDRISKSDITPYGIYRISTYKYADGDKQTLKGNDETFIFVTGIYQKKVYGIKLSNVQPIKFLNWLKRVIGVNKYKEGMKRINELKVPFDNTGNRIYDTYIKRNKDLIAGGSSYRTYNLDGIQYATEVFLNEKTLKQYYG